MANQLRFGDLAKGLAQSVARHGKLRRAATMMAVACANASAEAVVPQDWWDCIKAYADALANCENTYTQALADADAAFDTCVRAAKNVDEFIACFDAWDLAVTNAWLAFDDCQIKIADKCFECWKAVEGSDFA